MLNDEILTYDNVLNFVRNVVRDDIPKHKFSPCNNCSTAGSCCGCPKYDEWRKYIESNPILPYEQAAIEFIGKLKRICEY